MLEFAVFWIFAAILVIAALCVITLRNPVHSALFLVLAFFTAAALWMLLRAEFLAIALVLVYVGAVMVLFGVIVVAIALTRRKRKDTKYQGPARQAAVKRGVRVGLVSMPSEKND